MTELRDEDVEAGVKAMNEVNGPCGYAGPGGPCSDGPPYGPTPDGCYCRAEVRAILAAVLPGIVERERNRAAKVDAALRDAEHKLTCLCERFQFEDDLKRGDGEGDGEEWTDDQPCDAEDLCGHWACEEAGCIKDTRLAVSAAIRGDSHG